ncbi:unnamed protein product [Dicrocoelium dendriticum]|nr:unnamed protein product [Dicrocoelium dendriticum]
MIHSLNVKMDFELKIRSEITRRVKPRYSDSPMSGVLVKEFHLEEGAPTFLREIHFSNYYTGRITGKVCYQDDTDDKPTWLNLFRVQPMLNFHVSDGACAKIKISMPLNFDTSVNRHRLHRVCLLLQQPSPIWKEFSVREVPINW